MSKWSEMEMTDWSLLEMSSSASRDVDQAVPDANVHQQSLSVTDWPK